jgi:hypothetical protein
MDSKPFMRSQEDHTINHNADFLAYFLIFLLRHAQAPMAQYSIHLHPDTLAALDLLRHQLSSSVASEPDVMKTLHSCTWSLLSLPSPAFLQNAKNDPFSRFLAVYHLQDDHGTPAPAVQFPHNIARAQWSFRATACWEIIQVSKRTGENQHSQVPPFLTSLNAELTCILAVM